MSPESESSEQAYPWPISTKIVHIGALVVEKMTGIGLVPPKFARLSGRQGETEVEPAVLESRLIKKFGGLVNAISLPDIVLPQDPRRPIARLERFGLLTLVGDNLEMGNSLIGCGTRHKTSGIATMTYGAPGRTGRPYLDTMQAIGLTYRPDGVEQPWLVAVGGAGIDPDGKVFVRQLQDVTGVKRGDGRRGTRYYRTGLHNNMSWRTTLVRAWAEVGSKIGATDIVIQSNVNNNWEVVRHESDRVGCYDGVAQLMGFKADSDNNWVSPIAPLLAEQPQPVQDPRQA